MKVIRKPGDGAKRLAFLLKGIKTSNVGKVGYFKSAKYPAEKGKPAVPVAYVATIQEYGDPRNNIPARPTMRPAVKQHKNEWRQIAQEGAKKLLTGEETADGILQDIGLQAAGDIRENISKLVSPPIKQSTIDARTRQYADKTTPASNKPLIGIHKLLLNSVTNTVEPK